MNSVRQVNSMDIRTVVIIFAVVLFIGIWQVSADIIDEPVIPAFANDVKSSTDLSSITSLAFSSSLRLRDTAASGTVPAALEYWVDVRPAGNATAALGTIRTAFTATIMEANGLLGDDSAYYDPSRLLDPLADYWDKPAAQHSYRDETSAGGQIIRYTKNFKYTSGVVL